MDGARGCEAMRYRIYTTKERAERRIACEKAESQFAAMKAIPHPDSRYTGWVIHGKPPTGKVCGLMRSGWKTLPE